MADEEKKETAKKAAPKKAAAPRRTARTTRAKAAEVKAEEPKTTAADKEITETKHTEAEKPAIHKEEKIMTNRSSNRAAIPEAKSALDRFKYEVASEIGVPLKDGYNGDLTSAQAGSIGGEMVKKMIMKQEEQMSGK